MHHKNQLLAALPADDLRHLGALESVLLEARQMLEVPGIPIPYVYFVESGLVSVVGSAKADRIEVGMIGSEGMTGTAIVLGSDRSACEALVQSPGTALRIPAQRLRDAIAANPRVASVFSRYTYTLMTQSAQTALANGRGILGERLARWILMWHDRTDRDELVVTHEFLSLLLGVRRAGVTVALHVLEGHHYIRASRTLITVLDRAGLKHEANGFYGIPEGEYARLIGAAA
jgi:CRP-like cAMP-binding protein